MLIKRAAKINRIISSRWSYVSYFLTTLATPDSAHFCDTPQNGQIGERADLILKQNRT